MNSSIPFAVFCAALALPSSADLIFSNDMSSASSLADHPLHSGSALEETGFSYGFDSLEDVGNPDHALQVIWNYANEEFFEPEGSGETWLLFVQNGAAWNPAISGPLGGLDYSLDYQTSDSAFDSIWFFVQQNGQGRFASVSLPVNPDGAWHTVGLSNLVEANFNNSALYPDFDAAFPLTFGFAIAGGNPNGFGSTVASTNEILFDNFRVTAVPEPSSSFLVLLASSGFLAVRRRRIVASR